MLTLDHLTVSADRKRILSDFSFAFKPGATYVLMGPNGSGKSTLAAAIMGHPHYTLQRGSKLVFDGKNITRLAPDERARLGIFLSFQTPLELPGVTVSELLRIALEKRYDALTLHGLIHKYAAELDISPALLKRSLNVGFSGGERKKLEALQAALLAPRFALFDEIDTGVDVDALKTIARFLKRRLPKDTTTVYITHSTRLASVVQPDRVLVLKAGQLVRTGTLALAKKIEATGFAPQA